MLPYAAFYAQRKSLPPVLPQQHRPQMPLNVFELPEKRTAGSVFKSAPMAPRAVFINGRLLLLSE